MTSLLMKRTLTAAVGMGHRVESAHSPIKLGTVMLPIFPINVTNHGGSFVTFEAKPVPLCTLRPSVLVCPLSHTEHSLFLFLTVDDRIAAAASRTLTRYQALL